MQARLTYAEPEPDYYQPAKESKEETNQESILFWICYSMFN
jgi:hypothetical protein